jgi:hypothetical protein
MKPPTSRDNNDFKMNKITIFFCLHLADGSKDPAAKEREKKAKNVDAKHPTETGSGLSFSGLWSVHVTPSA